MPATLLDATAVTKSFAGVQALRGVSFDLRAGEVHALLGENGAGKSTLIKIITGAVAPDSGSLLVAGQPVPHMTPALARSLGIAAIYQQPALFPDLTVAENIALALETAGAWSPIDWRARRRRADALLARVGAPIDPDRLVESLSMPEQQIVEIAKAIGADAKIVIMDEPTAALTDREVEHLFQVVRLLRDGGAGIIYISHRLDEVFALADRITVLRDGETVATKEAAAVTRPELIAMMIGRALAAVFPKRTTPAAPVRDVAIEVRRVSNRSAGVHDVTFQVRRGEILGIAGLVGSGRTQLAETIFGLTPADSGEILRDGRPVVIASPADAIRAGIAYVPEDRRQHGVVLDMSIAHNASLASLDRVAPRGLIDAAAERRSAQRYVDRFRIKSASVDADVGTLSGGNQQKVALARWLATSPAVLILDEPTQGVDVGSKAEIHALMQELAEQGLAIIMISSELPEIIGMSDRVAVMHAGGVRAILERDQATQARIMSLALAEDAAGPAA
ncbi:MAG TPA: sugar ABC transporter ATP-binding protein [Vicinamibacterales bacterium]|nr:sugar ABC transporter ATP-binding protein [Vicinamibacterales bacterium]